jgi:glycosyltransferase involved in cell wall biosynthesis
MTDANFSGQKMRIAQISPLYENVPPKLYGGTERIVAYLTEELVDLGHDVTLFASGESHTKSQLVAVTEAGLRLQDPPVRDPTMHHLRLLEMVFAQAAEYDILHFHLDYLHLPFAKRSSGVCVTTMHGRLDLPDLASLYLRYLGMPFVSISDAQRAPLSWLNWCATVHHGIPAEQYSFHENPGSYLAFLGRIAPEKRLDRAIEIATKSGIPLKVAAKVDRADQEYFTSQIQALLRNPLVEFIGEIGEREKDEFLGKALALLFPIDWPEPFGLVTIESLATGTPVIAYPHGAVPEIIENGATGFLVESINDAVGAVARIHSLDRRLCRESFERRFTARRMARDYVALYHRLCSDRKGDDGRELSVVESAA